MSVLYSIPHSDKYFWKHTGANLVNELFSLSFNKGSTIKVAGPHYYNNFFSRVFATL